MDERDDRDEKTVVSVKSGATDRWLVESRLPAVVRGDCSRSSESVRAREMSTKMMSVTSGWTEKMDSVLVVVQRRVDRALLRYHVRRRAETCRRTWRGAPEGSQVAALGADGLRVRFEI